jgi:hypothetical protein
MLQNKQVHPYVVIDFVKALNFIFGNYLLFGNFVRALDLLDKSKVVIFHVALLKDDGSYFVLGSESFLGFGFFFISI